MTEETPAKVASLLGVALSSMFMLLAVSMTQASFQGTEVAMADPFSPAKVMSVLDNTSADYSMFLQRNLFTPVKNDLAFYQDTGSWIIDNSDMAIVKSLGLEKFAQADVGEPKVAGAFIDATMPQQAYVRPMTFLELIGLK